MTRIRVALDVNIPQRIVRMLQSAFGDQGFEFVWEPDFDKASAKDEHWAISFCRFGGSVVISGDRNIGKRPHQIVAFMDNGLVCFFLDPRWSKHDMAAKAAHLVMWWPRIQTHLPSCSPRDCWWVPPGLKDTPFRKIEIPIDVEEEARRAAQNARAR